VLAVVVGLVLLLVVSVGLPDTPVAVVLLVVVIVVLLVVVVVVVVVVAAGVGLLVVAVDLSCVRAVPSPQFGADRRPRRRGERRGVSRPG
jgi:hypothetical protein